MQREEPIERERAAGRARAYLGRDRRAARVTGVAAGRYRCQPIQRSTQNDEHETRLLAVGRACEGHARAEQGAPRGQRPVVRNSRRFIDSSPHELRSSQHQGNRLRRALRARESPRGSRRSAPGRAAVAPAPSRCGAGPLLPERIGPFDPLQELRGAIPVRALSGHPAGDPGAQIRWPRSWNNPTGGLSARTGSSSPRKADRM